MQSYKKLIRTVKKLTGLKHVNKEVAEKQPTYCFSPQSGYFVINGDETFSISSGELKISGDVKDITSVRMVPGAETLHVVANGLTINLESPVGIWEV